MNLENSKITVVILNFSCMMNLKVPNYLARFLRKNIWSDKE